MIEAGHPLSSAAGHEKDFVLIALLAVLGATIGLWSGGPIGFMQAIVEDLNFVAVISMASLVAVIFVLLIRRGLLIGDAEEIAS